MSYATIMVHVDTDADASHRIALAAGLSARFEAKLIGATARELPAPLTYGGTIVEPKATETRFKEAHAKLETAGATFKALASACSRVEWRATLEMPHAFICQQARAADLLIVGRDPVPGDLYGSLDPGVTVVKAGRPVLTVPKDTASLSASRVIVAWKDTREARRAVRDSLPLLRKAGRVSIAEIDERAAEGWNSNSLDDVVSYLSEHGVKATEKIRARAVKTVAGELMRIAHDEDADLIVAGAYGHSRLGEWIFGGVTHELLYTSPVCCLLSH